MVQTLLSPSTLMKRYHLRKSDFYDALLCEGLVDENDEPTITAFREGYVTNANPDSTPISLRWHTERLRPILIQTPAYEAYLREFVFELLDWAILSSIGEQICPGRAIEPADVVAYLMRDANSGTTISATRAMTEEMIDRIFDFS